MTDKTAVMPEICDNAIDDDLDGLIDLNDDECECLLIEPESLIPNPSFEDMNCCPNNRSQLNCADVWIQASEPTTDYIHTCGWDGWEQFPAPRPFPDGEAIMGFRDGRARFGNMGTGDNQPEFNWKEYAGACLLSPLIANDAYRFEFYVGFVDPQKSPDINISFFGSTDCANLPFGVGDNAFGCPTNGPNWVSLGAEYMSARGSGTWIKGTIDVVPEDDIHAIVIGPACERTISIESTYYFFDQLVLADTRSFEFVISEVNHPCAEDFTLSVPFENERDYQWYKDGVALVSETGTTLNQMYGNGDYQVRVIFDGSCTLVAPYTYTIPVFTDVSEVIICENDAYNFGDETLEESGSYIHTFKNINNCDSIVTLFLDVREPEFDTISGKIFEGESYQVEEFSFSSVGGHEAQLLSEVGCDSTVHLDLEYYQLFFPTAFSPNGDGVNDVFTVNGGDDMIEVTRLLIYDRWGDEIFTGDNFDDGEVGWNGRFQGQSAAPGSYVYRASVIMDDGKSRSFSGVVSLIR